MNELFFILGLTILTGFLSTIISERTRVSQVLLLMLFGFLLGPASGIVDASEDSVIVSLLPFLSTLALIVLLFDGGMSFDMFSLARAIPRSTAFSVATFLSGAIFIGLAAALMLGWPPIHGLLLGTVLGGTSSAIVIAMAERTGVSKETKSLLAVESTLTDAFCIIMAVIVINLIQADRLPEAGDFIHNLLSSFTLAMVVGAFSALAWMFLVSRFKVQKYSYMLTLALVFGLFAFTDAIRGNGGFAVFVFGLMLGNAEELDKYLKWKIHRPIGRAIKIFQEEMTFFVRTFFFVYMGLLLAPSYFGFHVLAVSVVVLALIAASRLLSKRLLLNDFPKRDANVAVAMMPRGLAAAVLATLPLTYGIAIPIFRELAFASILLTNIAATVGVFLLDKDEEKKTESEKLTEAVEAAEKEPEEPPEAKEAEGSDKRL